MSTSEQAPPSRKATGTGERETGSRNPIAAVVLFVRQVIAELRKVVIPTRREMIGYTVTVLAFVFLMILIVFGLDLGFGWLARFAFTTAGGAAS